MRYYIIAGEASGDLHGSNLIKQLIQQDGQASIRCWGGDRMQHAGGNLVKHYKELAFMGFAEVVLNLKTILGNFKFCKQDIAAFNPDVVILIDYPGFNLRMAKYLKRKGYKVFYYISPQIWAWHSSRARQIKKYVDRMFVILPFEKEFYQQWNYAVDFVGHPLLDAMADMRYDPDFFKHNALEDKQIIALLPGSRKQEIKRMLPAMLEMVHLFPGYQFVIGGLGLFEETFYRQFIHHPHVKLVMDKTYDLLENARSAIVTSGTATLETALHKVPQVVCYKGNWFSYLFGRYLVNVKYIALVNLILDRPLIAELIQRHFTTNTLRKALSDTFDQNKRAEMISGYHALKNLLGGAGASERTARLMIKYLNEST